MDKYEKVKKIGEGSFGKAILVKCKEDGRHYIIKEISISGMPTRERQESRKEVALLAKMSHPNIVQYKESFQEAGCLYIVMDYCEGGDLFKKINSQKGVLFSEEQILDWFVQICLALKHVHDRKILHRDIKSQNIFLTKDGTVQLGDFGIARVLNSTVELARTCIGTPYYLSPEICENKPYNNKSDIWALGCVLYEMCTLKHAFEAGNMKNLVLKIIRGSYPPVSVHYSQELRSLLAQLFKRNPRERPSVSSVLDIPFLSTRIQKFLTPQLIAQEFQHSFQHRQPKVSESHGPTAKRPPPGCSPLPPAQKITKPAAKYGVPLTVRKVSDAAKKPVERRALLKHKAAPPPAASKRREDEEERRQHEEGVRKKRMELIEKERKQREQMFLLRAEQMKRYEKEKISRINQAREQGWKHVLSSSGGSSPEKKCFAGVRHRAARPGPSVPAYAQGPGPSQVSSQSPYDSYQAGLDQTSKPQSKDLGRDGPSPAPASPRRVPVSVGTVQPHGPTYHLSHDVIKRELQRLQYVTVQARISRQKGQMAADRANQVEEFLQRKREAMLNKVRAEGQLGTRQSLAAIFMTRTGSVQYRRPRVDKEEEEYLKKLRQIRLLNFNERQQIRARLRGEKVDSDGSDSPESSEEAELRRKKIEAVKAQANARAAVLKEQLEKKRREAYEREKKAWEEHLAARGLKVGMIAATPAAAPVSSSSESPPPQTETVVTAVASTPPKPSTPDISMTAALKNVGVMTPPKLTTHLTETSSGVQTEKKQILHRLNQNLKGQGPVESLPPPAPPPTEPGPAPPQNQSDTENQPSSNDDRRKWDAAGLPVLPVAQETLAGMCETTHATPLSVQDRPPSGGDRKKWEAGVPLIVPVAQQTLEETCFTTMEETSGVIQLQQEAQRKVWPSSPDSQVLKLLKEAELQPLTQQLEELTMVQDDCNWSPAPDQDPASQPKPPAAQETSVTVNGETASLTFDLTQTQDPADVESLVLDETPKQDCPPPAGVQLAWKEEEEDEDKQELAVQQPLPPEGDSSATVNKEGEKCAKKQAETSAAQWEEPLFVKLCSPVHRRTAALAALSAQSSVEDSSSSLTSRSRSVSPLRSKPHSSLLIGLSQGMFDANNPKMLRTCSLPDLSRLFSALQDSAAAAEADVPPDNNMEMEDLEDGAKEEEEEQSETEEAYEDEDLRNIRASMERLLQEDQDVMRDTPEEGAGDFNGNASVLNEVTPDIDQDNNLMNVDEDDDEDVEEEEDEEADEEEEEEEECSNGSPGDEEVGEPLSNGMEGENHSNCPINEEWHSDSSGEDQGGDTGHYDSIFSRLEELRFNLEQQMGFEKFIQAYNKIKAIHEDEDENIDLGSSLVLRILGTEHQHLYPNILHLVMADGVYQEDNED
ncbi:serine/threonine-protein kinase Nek1 isoform X2 [Cynoglossus semilaevis]|uniref:serine/threonine-protein kinase Nek1 isoform X2 n=1 Tax=Cynoglossus semilaevis TaxID=244447 RepID=UPI0007DCAC6D|nr:serine/threonine-protein kinase Nek1 isoform X2 [Cynoglossus semilaevis]